MTRRIRILLAAASTVSLVGMAGPAAAAGLGQAEDVRYKKITATLAGDAGQPSTANMYGACDNGWTALADGQAVGAQDRIAVSALSGSSTWLSAVWHQAAAATTVASYATCLKTTKTSQVAAHQQNIAADTSVSGQAMCKPGQAAVSGGPSSAFDRHDWALNSSFPIDDDTDTDTVPDDGWRIYTQYSGPGGDNVAFNVMCLGGPRPAYRRTSVTLPPFGSATAQALCPKSRPTIGGGTLVNGSTDAAHMVTSRPWDSGDAGTVPEDGWRGGVVNDSGSTLTMTVHAICR